MTASATDIVPTDQSIGDVSRQLTGIPLHFPARRQWWIAMIVALALLALFIVSVKASTLPTEIYHYLEYSTDPQIAALSVILILISIGVVVAVERLIGLRRAL